MAIEYGSIEVIGPNDNNYGMPITPLFPLDLASASTQVKNRTGVTLGSKLPDTPDGFDQVPQGLKGRWQGTSAGGDPVEVRIWQTAN